MSSRSFDGVNQYLRKVNMPVGARTLAGWGLTSTQAGMTLMQCEHWAGIPPARVGLLSIQTQPAGATNRLSCSIVEDGVSESGATTSFAMTLGEWFHFCVTIDVDNINVYLNGGFKGSAGYTESRLAWPRHSIASSYGGGNYFDGQIAHVSMWNLPLTDAEVLALYEGRCPPMDVSSEIFAVGSLYYYATLDHDNLCEWGDRSGFQLVWSPRNAPTFSDEDPNVYPMVGGMVQL